MSMSANIHDVTSMEAKELPGGAVLRFEADNLTRVSAFMPFHAAQAAADAFNRAMQAKPNKFGGLSYQSADDLWMIARLPNGEWRGQSDEVTGDGDPPDFFACSSTLLDLLDEIDRTVSQRETPICKRTEVLA